MNNKEYQEKYRTYVCTHIENVQKGFNWLRINMAEWVRDNTDPFLLDQIIRNHDRSKFSEDEFDAYAKYFNVDRQKYKSQFDVAWLHHIHNNRHHPEHWNLVDNGVIKPLPMPMEYVVEMFCDWWAFSWTKGNLNEVFGWYEENKGKFVMHEKTRSDIENLLDIVKKKLDEESATK